MMRNLRGQLLHTVHYKVPAGKQLRAALVFHHGLGEHIGRYDRVFKLIASYGYAVHSLDAHGHGLSEPLVGSPDRCLIHSVDHLVDDLLQLVNDDVLPRYAAPFPPPVPSTTSASAVAASLRPSVPLFLAGHSMGGLVACHTALRGQAMWAGMLLHSAAIDADWTPVLRLQAPLGGLLAAVAPRARIVPAVRPQDMSPDPETVRKYIEDPLNFVGNVRAKTANEILKGFRSLQQRQAQLRLPIYAGHGTDDHCTSLPAVRALLKGVSSNDVTLYMIEGGYHELFHGPEWEDCSRRMVAWMEARTPPLQPRGEPLQPEAPALLRSKL